MHSVPETIAKACSAKLQYKPEVGSVSGKETQMCLCNGLQQGLANSSEVPENKTTSRPKPCEWNGVDWTVSEPVDDSAQSGKSSWPRFECPGFIQISDHASLYALSQKL